MSKEILVNEKMFIDGEIVNVKLPEKNYHNILEIVRPPSTIKSSYTATLKVIHFEDVHKLVGILKTYVDSLGFKEPQLKAVKDVVNGILWDWYSKEEVSGGIHKANWVLATAEKIKKEIK